MRIDTFEFWMRYFGISGNSIATHNTSIHFPLFFHSKFYYFIWRRLEKWLMCSHFNFHLSAFQVFRRDDDKKYFRNVRWTYGWIGFIGVCHPGTALCDTLFLHLIYSKKTREENIIFLYEHENRAHFAIRMLAEPKQAFYLTSRLLNHIIVKRNNSKNKNRRARATLTAKSTQKNK